MGFKQLSIQVIVPARNEQDCLATCLESLSAQQGVDFRVTVVDDESTDSTRSIAESFSGVRVIGSDTAMPGATGKCNALICGTREVQAEWILFTDADTWHYPGSLAAALEEARRSDADLLSYSPEQEAATWGEKALMPVVFSELAGVYPPTRVNDTADPLAAANGQYILVRRRVYEDLGGHSAIADKVLEDVELARLFKSAGRKILFRHGTGLVRTRMYRNFPAMVEGWTKNLSLLFRHPVRLAIVRALEFVVILVAGSSAVSLIARHHLIAGPICLLAALLFYANFVMRILSAHFPWSANLAAFWGLPLFSFLLLRSYVQSEIRGAVRWKGRTYSQRAARQVDSDSSI
jgi:glycosyltransferase involved in cell wall biosynthesis